MMKTHRSLDPDLPGKVSKTSGIASSGIKGDFDLFAVIRALGFQRLLKLSPPIAIHHAGPTQKQRGLGRFSKLPN